MGRDAERAQLLDSWKSVVAGERRLMLLSGEPGIGKTTLSAQFAADVYGQGGLVVYGRSDEDLGVPYQPWIEALGQLVTNAPEAVLAEHVADRGAHLARLVPDLARRLNVESPASGDGDSERFVLYGCVTDLLARVSADQPVLFVLDDLHWADRATVQLLRHVATADQPMRVGVLGTFRDSDIGSDHPVSELLAALHREGGAQRIALHGLSDLDLLALLETIAGHAMDDDGVVLRDALLAETAGNPFFVAEILRHLAETGALYQREDGHWVAEADLRAVGLPVSVREVIGRRLATLGPDSERVLALAAVIGRDFDIALLAAVANIDEDTVIDQCDAAVAAAVLATTDRAGRYTFAHALIEHTLYESLSPTRRARAHRTIAEALEGTLGDQPGDRTAELAYHWAAAVQPADNTKAIHYAQLAGDRALAQLAPDEAIRWYQSALELLDRAYDHDSRQRIEILVGLGIGQRQTGDAAHRLTLLDAARLADEHDHVDLLARAAVANNRGWFSALGTEDSERVAVLDRALERLDGVAAEGRPVLLALAALERTYSCPLAERVTLAEQAVNAARPSGDPAVLAAALSLPFIGISYPSTLALRTAWIDEACAIADRMQDPAAAFWAHMSALRAAVERADGDAVDMHFTKAEQLAARIPDASVRWVFACDRAWRAGLSGDLAEFERLAEAALNEGVENGQVDAFGMYSAQVANFHDLQGRLHELIPLIEEASINNPGLPVFGAVLAQAKARAGERDEVRTMLAKAAAEGFHMPEDTQWTSGIACWAEAAAFSGAVDVAHALRGMLKPYHDQIVASGATVKSSIAHYLGWLDHLLGDLDSAEEWFIEALGLHERVRSPFLVAQTQAAFAAVLADRDGSGDHERAREIASVAIDAASAGGYGYVEADARAVLDRLASPEN